MIARSGSNPAPFLSVRKSTPLQTWCFDRDFVFVKYKNYFTNMFVNMLTFTNTYDIIRTD